MVLHWLILRTSHLSTCLLIITSYYVISTNISGTASCLRHLLCNKPVVESFKNCIMLTHLQQSFIKLVLKREIKYNKMQRGLHSFFFRTKSSKENRICTEKLTQNRIFTAFPQDLTQIVSSEIRPTKSDPGSHHKVLRQTIFNKGMVSANFLLPC